MIASLLVVDVAVCSEVAGVGVGPWDSERPGEMPDLGRMDAELLADGDHRNVVDRYRYWTEAAIKADLAASRAASGVELHVAIENLTHGFNIGSIVRTANAFNAAAVHIVGARRFNRRGAMCTDRYLSMRHHDDDGALAGWAAAEGLPLIGIDNIAGSQPIECFAFPARCVLVFGTEGAGLSSGAATACERVLHITQRGSTRSLNAGAAAAIAMYAWATKH